MQLGNNGCVPAGGLALTFGTSLQTCSAGGVTPLEGGVGRDSRHGNHLLIPSPQNIYSLEEQF